MPLKIFYAFNIDKNMHTKLLGQQGHDQRDSLPWSAKVPWSCSSCSKYPPSSLAPATFSSNHRNKRIQTITTPFDKASQNYKLNTCSKILYYRSHNICILYSLVYSYFIFIITRQKLARIQVMS